MRVPDPEFADPRQAALYDFLDGERTDLDTYAAIAHEVVARSVVDVGCGTGSLATGLAADGFSVVGVDPAVASLDVARTKPNSELVSWVLGDATVVGGLGLAADLVVMTGNVAQVFVSDEEWSDTLDAVHGILLPGGRFVFEVRRPEARAWAGWDVAPTSIDLPDGTPAILTRVVTEVALPLVTFERSIAVGAVTLRSVSTLRFRERGEIERDLAAHGFVVEEVRDAPDRPGREHVFVARRTQADPGD
ncbi:MAG: class I SAM-dependent methyltransferase [Nocardioidaceae bacterium]|nr:class I SAM-dependent methyltransferase [Nocardioidaceae bacterium]